MEIPEFVGPLYQIPNKVSQVSPMKPRPKSSMGKKIVRPKSAGRISQIGSLAQ